MKYYYILLILNNSNSVLPSTKKDYTSRKVYWQATFLNLEIERILIMNENNDIQILKPNLRILDNYLIIIIDF